MFFYKAAKDRKSDYDEIKERLQKIKNDINETKKKMITKRIIVDVIIINKSKKRI